MAGLVTTGPDGVEFPKPHKVVAMKPANVHVVVHAPPPDCENPCPICLEHADDASVQVPEVRHFPAQFPPF